MHQPKQTLSSVLFRLWVWLHVACIAALLWRPSTPAVFLGRYSRNALLIAGILVVTLPVAFIVSRWVRRQRFPMKTPPVVVILAGAASVGVAWALPIASAVPYVVVRLYVTLVVFSLMVWVLNGQTQTGSVFVWRWAAGLALVGVGVVVAAAFRYPGMIWTDEGYMIAMGLSFNQTGVPTPLLWGDYQGTSLLSVGYMALGPWLQLTGVSLTSGRLFMLFLAGIMLAVNWVTVRHLLGRYEAWTVTIIGVFAVIQHNVLRQDILSSVYVAGALLCIGLAGRDGPGWLHALAGFFIGFSPDGHPTAYRFGVGFGLAYLIEYGLILRERGRWVWWRPFYGLALGGVLGTGAFLVLYTSWTSYISNYTETSPFVLGFRWEILSRHIEVALQTVPFLLGVAVLGAVLGNRVRPFIYRVLVIVLGVSVAVLVVLYPMYRSYYQTHTLSLLLLLAALALHQVPREGWGRLAAAWVLFAGGAGFLLRGYTRNAQDYRATLDIAAEIRAILPPETRVSAVDPFYFELHEFPFFEQQITSVVAQQQGVTPAEMWERIAPQAVTVLYDYPLTPPPAMLDYIAAQDMVCVRHWEVDTVGEVALYVVPELGLSPASECRSGL